MRRTAGSADPQLQLARPTFGAPNRWSPQRARCCLFGAIAPYGLVHSCQRHLRAHGRILLALSASVRRLPPCFLQALLDTWLSLWQWVFQPAIGVLMLGAVSPCGAVADARRDGRRQRHWKGAPALVPLSSA